MHSPGACIRASVVLIAKRSFVRFDAPSALAEARSSVVAAGNTNSCAFTVTVNTPNSVCFADDASGDTFFEVVDSASPLYGFWRYRTAGGTIYCAKAEYTYYVAGRSLISYNHANATYAMDCNANLANRTATVTLTVRATGARYTLRDSNTTNNPPCPD